MVDNKPQELFERQMQYLRSKEVDTLIETNYNENAELINMVSEPFIVKGKNNLKSHFKDYLDNLGEFKEVDVYKSMETEDCLSIEANVTLNQNGQTVSVNVYDSFYLENGKISRHFTGMKG